MKKLLIMMMLLLLMGCSNNKETNNNVATTAEEINTNIIATVNGVDIELDTFDMYYAMQSYDFEKEFGKSVWEVEQNGKTMREIRQDQTLDYLIRVALVEAYLNADGVTVDQTVIDEAYKRYMTSIEKDEEIKSYFAENGLDELFLKRFLEDQYYLRLYEDQLLVDISNNPLTQDLLFKDKVIRYKTRHILFDSQASLAEVQALLSDEEDPADFSDMARLYSIHSTSAVKGGDLGYILVGNMPEAYEKVALEIEAYTVSEPVQTEYGYHLIFVDDRQMLQDMIDTGMPEDEIETYKADIIKNYAATESIRIFEKMKAGAVIVPYKERLNRELLNGE